MVGLIDTHYEEIIFNGLPSKRQEPVGQENPRDEEIPSPVEQVMGNRFNRFVLDVNDVQFNEGAAVGLGLGENGMMGAHSNQALEEDQHGDTKL